MGQAVGRRSVPSSTPRSNQVKQKYGSKQIYTYWAETNMSAGTSFEKCTALIKWLQVESAELSQGRTRLTVTAPGSHHSVLIMCMAIHIPSSAKVKSREQESGRAASSARWCVPRWVGPLLQDILFQNPTRLLLLSPCVPPDRTTSAFRAWRTSSRARVRSDPAGGAQAEYVHSTREVHP
mgnify:FL=1